MDYLESGGPKFRYRERAALLTVAFAALPGILFVALNGLAPFQRPWSFALVLFAASTIVYAAIISPVVIVLGMAGERRRHGLRILAVALLAACVVPNREALGALPALGGPGRFRLFVPIAFLCGAAALAIVGWSRRGGIVRLLVSLEMTAAIVGFWPVRGAAPDIPTARALEVVPTAADPAHRFLLIGLDGADWDYIDPLIARGEMPHLAKLRAEGISGSLKSTYPTKSPVIWTTIATGRPPTVHGVFNFTSTRVRGAGSAELPRVRSPRGLGFGRLFARLVKAGIVYQTPARSDARRVPAYWDLATTYGAPVDLVDWWVTWPAYPILGHVVSDRAYYFRASTRGAPRETSDVTFPGELYAEIEPLLVRPDDVRFEDARPFLDVTRAEFAALMAAPFRGKTIEGEFKYVTSMFESDRRIAAHVIERSRQRFGGAADMMIVFRIVDLACHAALAESELVEDHLGASEERLRKYRRVVSEAYRAADRAIGELAAAFGPANVIVISDHGFELEAARGGQHQYHHSTAPDGIFAAAGPAFGRGKVEGVSVFDVLPLLAYLKGFPVAADLDGRVPLEVFDVAFTAKHPVDTVASYGKRAPPATWIAQGRADEAVMDHLRAVGYVQ